MTVTNTLHSTGQSTVATTATLDSRDADGFDREGYDKDGFDRNGFDRQLYSRKFWACYEEMRHITTDKHLMVTALSDDGEVTCTKKPVLVPPQFDPALRNLIDTNTSQWMRQHKLPWKDPYVQTAAALTAPVLRDRPIEWNQAFLNRLEELYKHYREHLYVDTCLNISWSFAEQARIKLTKRNINLDHFEFTHVNSTAFCKCRLTTKPYYCTESMIIAASSRGDSC